MNQKTQGKIEAVLDNIPQLEEPLRDYNLQGKILGYLYETRLTLKPIVIANELELKPHSVRGSLALLLKKGWVTKTNNGEYYVNSNNIAKFYGKIKKAFD